MEEKLQQLKIMLGIDDTDEDELLTLLLTQSGKKIVRAVYPYGSTNEDVPSRYSFLQVEVAERMYNQRGAEGETSHDENGVNRTYQSIEDFIISNVVPFCGVPKAVSSNAQS